MWTIALGLLAAIAWIGLEWFMARAASQAGPEILSITAPDARTTIQATANGQQPTAKS